MYFRATFQESFPEISADGSAPPHVAITDLPKLSLPHTSMDISAARKANCMVLPYSTATPMLPNFIIAVLAVIYMCAICSLQFFYCISPQIFASLIPPLTPGHIHVFPLLCLICSRAVPATEGRANIAPPPPNCCFFLSSFYMWQCWFSSHWYLVLHEMLEKSIFFLI